jgi:hypothetical protein
MDTRDDLGAEGAYDDASELIRLYQEGGADPEWTVDEVSRAQSAEAEWRRSEILRLMTMVAEEGECDEHAADRMVRLLELAGHHTARVVRLERQIQRLRQMRPSSPARSAVLRRRTVRRAARRHVVRAGGGGSGAGGDPDPEPPPSRAAALCAWGGR